MRGPVPVGSELPGTVRYFDGGGSPLATWNTGLQTTADWTQYDDIRLAPTGTRSIQVELRCQKPSGDYCDGYFDAMELRAVYP